MASPSIRILGAYAIQHADGSVEPRPPNQTHALLGFLVITAGRTHSREELLEFLWPDEDPEATKPRLRQILHTVRQAISKVTDSQPLVTDRATVRLERDGVPTDYGAFLHAVAVFRAASTDPERIAALREADSAYGGDLLPGYYQEPIVRQRERLRQEHVACLHSLVSMLSAAGKHADAVDAGKRLVAADPESEEAHAELIRAYIAAGERGAARQQCRELERMVRENLDAEPSDASRSLFATVESLSRNPGAEAPRPTPPAAPDSVPAPPTISAVPRLRARRSSARLWFVAIPSVAACLILAFWRLHGPAKPPTNRKSLPAGVMEVPALNELWHKSRPPLSNQDDVEPHAIFTDAQAGRNGRFVYVTGLVRNRPPDKKGENVDYLTVKYDPAGRMQEDPYNGLGNDLDRAHSIAVDHDGCIYVTGESDHGNGGKGPGNLPGVDITTIKYDPDMKRSDSWPDIGFGKGVRRYNSKFDGEDVGRKVCVDRQRNVYVLGRCWRPGGRELVLLKYGPDGKLVENVTLSNQDRDVDPISLCLDHAGNVLVLFSELGDLPHANVTWSILKLRPDGKRIWPRGYGYLNGADNRAVALAICPDDSVVVTGTGLSPDRLSGAGNYIITRKYDSNGLPLWERLYPDIPRTANVLVAVTVDREGRIYVLGGAPDGSAAATICYEPNGDRAWVDNLTTEFGPQSVWPSSIVSDGFGVYVAGGARGIPWSYGPGLFVLHYDSSGKRTALGYYPSPSSDGLGPILLSLDIHGQPVVSTWLNEHGTHDLFTLQFSGLPQQGKTYPLIRNVP